MTDEEIIKGLMCCSKDDGSCEPCPFWEMESPECIHALVKNTLDLIKRQNEELEKLKTSPIIAVLCPMWKAEAIRAFAKHLIDKSENGVISVCDIPDFVKEMTEVKDNAKV